MVNFQSLEGFLFYFKLYDLLNATIYLFTYLTGFMKQGLIYAKLGLNL